MKLWAAVIEHAYGSNLYLSRTEEGLYEKLYEFVAMYWNELDDSPPLPENDKYEAVKLYFEEHLSDYLHPYGEVEVEL